MSYEVKIIADSIARHGARLTTFQLRYPRMIHAEVLTHRAISRNASSTRAIPMAKQLDAVKYDPAVPVYWGRNRSGMQATQELADEDKRDALQSWLWTRECAVESAEELVDIGIHKQIAGRIIEPWAHISVVATATAPGWMNFFSLRCHKAAMPEIQALAVPMARAYRDSIPAELAYGAANRLRWHLPYITKEETEALDLDDLVPISVARCARVSYLTHDGVVTDRDADIALHNTLRDNGHWSPFEHIGFPSHDPKTRSGNFVGWVQYRQLLPVSVHREFDFSTLDQFGDRDFIV